VYRLKKSYLFIVCSLFFISWTCSSLFAGEENAANKTAGEHSTEQKVEGHQATHESSGKFKPGEFIFEHIKDAHDWHITTIGEHHISIPLPIIVYSKTTGMHIFMSSKFEHGHAEYQGLKLGEEGKLKGKVIEVGSDVLPLDLSITKDVTSIIISILLISFMFISVAKKYKRNPETAPSGLQNALEVFILFVRDEVAKPSIGTHYKKFMPYLLTVFFFIWINNMMGLIPIFPGGANVTGNISVTAILALFTFMLTTINGNKHYWAEVFNAPGVPWWLKIPIPLMPVVELAGMFTKPIVLMIRLFANIAAGHIIALGFFSLIFIFAQIAPALGYGVSVLTVIFVIFMSVLELLVALIQAYVFTLLSAIFFGMATAEHHEEGNEGEKH
jgi:F-type H+-transporting ATPase subunit a